MATRPVRARNVGRSALPDELMPELATLVSAPPASSEDWVFEVKFDGYRMLARIDGDDVRLISPNAKDWTAKLLPLQAELRRLEFAVRLVIAALKESVAS